MHGCKTITGSCFCLWWHGLHQTHLLKLHRRQSPRRRPASSETPGPLSRPPSLLAEGPLPTPWRPESPVANRKRFIGVEVSAEKGYAQYYTWTLEGWRQETGDCEVFTFTIYYLLKAFATNPIQTTLVWTKLMQRFCLILFKEIRTIRSMYF